MSGGSYDYIYSRIEDAADCLRNKHGDPRRAAFAKLLYLVSEAMHDIEWVDSCDYGPGDEHKAIDACFEFLNMNPTTAYKAAAFDRMAELAESLKPAKEREHE